MGKINHSTAEINNRLDDIPNIKSGVATNAQKIISVQGNVSSLSQSVSALSGRVTRLSTTVESNTTLITDLEGDLHAEWQARAAGDASLQQYTDDSCQTLDAKVDTAVASLQAQINALKTQVRKMGDALSEYKKDVNN